MSPDSRGAAVTYAHPLRHTIHLFSRVRGGHVTQICDRLLGCYRFRCHNRTDVDQRVRWSWRAATGDLELAALR